MIQYNYIIVFLLFFACTKKEVKFDVSIINNQHINTEFLSKIDEPEKALISAYLYAYGNECVDTSTNVKSQILKQLKITDECDTTHLNHLSKWFKNDVIMFYKFKNCPALPYNSAIQNQIKQMELYRHNDTLKISILVYGLNNSQEKNWNSHQTETFLIKNREFIKLNSEIETENKSNCLSCQKKK